MTISVARSPVRSLPRPQAKRRRRHPARFAVLVALGILLLLVVAPLLVVALNAVKSPADYAGNGPLSIPESLHWSGIVDFWQRVDFSRKLWNSFITSLVVAVATGVHSAIADGRSNPARDE